MNNEEKAKELAHDYFRRGQLGFVSPDTESAGYDCAIKMAQWKDEQVKQLLVEKTKLLSSSATQDSIKRCTIEEIYRELFNEEMPNSNPYIK